jgi:hypothetical protein
MSIDDHQLPPTSPSFGEPVRGKLMHEQVFVEPEMKISSSVSLDEVTSEGGLT